MIFLSDFSFVRIFLRNYRVTMTTTLDTSCSENTVFGQQGEGFCMHVFSSIVFTLHEIKQRKFFGGHPVLENRFIYDKLEAILFEEMRRIDLLWEIVKYTATLL